ncbi:MAG: Asp-tRNA(Asn)/Glu-tRNA(Gln) amidotransferase subunit GatC [Myxococcota bacterium]|jgi:aspartyl-tRNA(Asn)/glutamyl-tRNA(Gln) amidotransferase subunit C|nr:Asp-tRNA(Asn)/Glu-tRNA(Gln) amidotransferase subunit GatC [Myxococcota bacterium]
MKFSSGEVAHLAKLSRLELSELEQENIGQDLEKILGYVAKLDELDVSQVEPTTHAVELAMQLREDHAQQVFDREQVLANAPAVSDGMFRVPKVVGDS